MQLLLLLLLPSCLFCHFTVIDKFICCFVTVKLFIEFSIELLPLLYLSNVIGPYQWQQLLLFLYIMYYFLLILTLIVDIVNIMVYQTL